MGFTLMYFILQQSLKLDCEFIDIHPKDYTCIIILTRPALSDDKKPVSLGAWVNVIWTTALRMSVTLILYYKA